MNIPLSSQPWYHGKITRLRSEQLLETDGQFLIRDSISKPGDYVLTARWRGKALHFQVNRAEEDGRTMYQFEDEQFTSVVSLIQFYVSHRRTVTFASGCIIHEAVPVDATPAQRPRSSEYRELEANYAHFFRPGKPATPAAPARSLSQQVLLNQAMRLRREPLPAKSASPRIAPKPKVPPLPAALVNKPLPIPERSPRGDEGDEYCEMDYDAMDEMDMILNACGLSASMLTLADRSTSNSSLYSPSNSLARNYQSCADLTWRQQPGSNRQSVEFDTVRDSACVLDGSDSEESRSSGRRSEAAESRKSAGDPDYDLPKKGADDDYDMPSGTPRAVLKKSLNETFVRKLREYLLNRTAEEIALDICREDARILNFYEYTSTADNGLCKMLLPAGRDIRDLLLTRIRCLQLTVVVSILGAERRYAIRLLSQWIHVATRLLKSLGNHFAFFNVFCGLTCKMLESPAWLWTTVTDGDQARLDECTMTFDSLRNTGMTTPSAATTAIPLLQPILQIFSCADLQAVNDTDSSSSDLDSLWRWLEMAREWTSVATGLATLAVERYGQWADSPLAVASLRGLLGLDGHDDNSRFIALQTELQRAAASL